MYMYVHLCAIEQHYIRGKRRAIGGIVQTVDVGETRRDEGRMQLAAHSP